MEMVTNQQKSSLYKIKFLQVFKTLTDVWGNLPVRYLTNNWLYTYTLTIWRILRECKDFNLAFFSWSSVKALNMMYDYIHFRSCKSYIYT